MTRLAAIMFKLLQTSPVQPNIRTGDYDSAYEYCNWAMNELGIDERDELNILMTADDLFGGHATLNQTVVRSAPSYI